MRGPEWFVKPGDFWESESTVGLWLGAFGLQFAVGIFLFFVSLKGKPERNPTWSSQSNSSLPHR